MANPIMPRASRFPCALIAILVILCGLLTTAGGAYFILARASADPVVQISAPTPGARVPVGQEVMIQSLARDDQKIRRVELWVDGRLYDAQMSSVPGGISPFPLIANWSPPISGTHTIIARAYNTRGGQGQATISIEALANTDRDNDGVPDASDDCPDQPGSPAARGCPDRDRDGIRDSDDACPDQPGLPANRGCPTPSVQDHDGDGILDSADSCPDQPGSPLAQGCPDADGDGIADASDACPREPGPRSNNGCPVPNDQDADGVPDASDACPRDPGTPGTRGCPDSDGDGVADREDACPHAPGLPGLSGCPDRDGDGVRDLIDLCPDVPGPASNAGCPVSGAGDSDGDGVRDDTDLAPGEAGPADGGGTSPPGGGTDPEGDTEPGERGPFGDMGGEEAIDLVRADALEFSVTQDYDRIYCYAGQVGREMERYGSFRALGNRQWDIAEYMGGANSRTFGVVVGQALQLHVECIGSVGTGAFGIVRNLGSFTRAYDSSQWDGHIIEELSGATAPERGDPGHSFRVKFRLCRRSCDASAFPPPTVRLTHERIGPIELHYLGWNWSGNRSDITGFRLYVNGNRRATIRNADANQLNLREYLPECGERAEYSLTAYRSDAGIIRESPPSNRVSITGEACPRRVQVTFQQLQTRELCCETSPVGPITGNLWANDQQLRFDASDLSYFGTFNGLWLENNHTYDILNLLQIIARWQDSCLGRGCPSYSAPRDNRVTLSLNTSADLTVGIRINNVNKVWVGLLFGGYNEITEIACTAQIVIPARQIADGAYRANGDRCGMNVALQLLP
jgi:hypothetical protein